jgi:hypothetical protein
MSKDAWQWRNQNVGWVSVFCVTHQALRCDTMRFLNVCLTARLVGYGANDAPNPPYIGKVAGNVGDIPINDFLMETV